MSDKEKINQIINKINRKSKEQNDIKKKLGARFDSPKDQHDINQKEKWFALHSQILDLTTQKKTLKSEE